MSWLEERWPQPISAGSTCQHPLADGFLMRVVCGNLILWLPSSRAVWPYRHSTAPTAFPSAVLPQASALIISHHILSGLAVSALHWECWERIPEDEHVNIALFRNNTHLTETSQHAFKLGRGRILMKQWDKRVKCAYVPVHVLRQSHKAWINV